jgi:hypothetical protein
VQVDYNVVHLRTSLAQSFVHLMVTPHPYRKKRSSRTGLLLCLPLPHPLPTPASSAHAGRLHNAAPISTALLPPPTAWGRPPATRGLLPAARLRFPRPTRHMARRGWHPGIPTSWMPRRRLRDTLKTMCMVLCHGKKTIFYARWLERARSFIRRIRCSN